LVGSTLGHFRVERLIGAGGVGAVYLAVDEKLEREVAVKVLLEGGDSPVARKRFLREARLAARLTHPNIATVFEVGEFDAGLYIVLELLEGQSLRKYMVGRKPMPLEAALGVARDVARALAKAHAAGITHRDIKPENVFITQPAQGVLHAKVLDFGLARQQVTQKRLPENEDMLSTETTAAGDVVGTPGYWSPEQARAGEVDARTDVFSFGLVFYEILTGRRAFSSTSTVQLVLAAARHDPEPIRKFLPNLPPEIEAFLARCLKKPPHERFADGTELLTELEQIVRSLRASKTDLDGYGSAPVIPPVSSAPAVSRPGSEPGPHARQETPYPTKSAPTPGPTSVDRFPFALPFKFVAPRDRLPLMAAMSAGIGVALAVLLVVILMVGRSVRDRSSADHGARAVGALEGGSTVATADDRRSAPETTSSPLPAAANAAEPAPAAPAPAAPAEEGDVSSFVAPPGGGTPTPVVVSPLAAVAAAPAVPAAPAVLPAAPVVAPAAPPVVRPPAAPRASQGSAQTGRRPADCAEPFTRDKNGVKIPKLHCL